MRARKPIQFGTDGRSTQGHPVQYFGHFHELPKRPKHRGRKVLVMLAGIGQKVLHDLLGGGGGLGASRGH